MTTVFVNAGLRYGAKCSVTASPVASFGMLPKMRTGFLQLNARGQKRFTGKFPHGVTKAQATVPKHPGYIAGFSTIKTIVR